MCRTHNSFISVKNVLIILAVLAAASLAVVFLFTRSSASELASEVIIEDDPVPMECVIPDILPEETDAPKAAATTSSKKNVAASRKEQVLAQGMTEESHLDIIVTGTTDLETVTQADIEYYEENNLPAILEVVEQLAEVKDEDMHETIEVMPAIHTETVVKAIETVQTQRVENAKAEQTNRQSTSTRNTHRTPDVGVKVEVKDEKPAEQVIDNKPATTEVKAAAAKAEVVVEVEAPKATTAPKNDTKTEKVVPAIQVVEEKETVKEVVETSNYVVTDDVAVTVATPTANVELVDLFE